MAKPSFLCLRSIALLYFHLPILLSQSYDGYHTQLCVGDVEFATNSLGSGSQEYHQTALAYAAYASPGCFDPDEADKNTFTPNYIVYKSTDFQDTSETGSTLFGWLSVQVTVPDGLDSFVIQPFAPTTRVQFVPGEIVTTRFATGCRENLGGQGFPKKHLAPCFYASDPGTTVPSAATWVGKALKEFRFTFRADFPECAMINEKETFEFRFYGNRQRNLNRCGHSAAMFTAPLNKIGVRNSTYGGYDPEPPRDSPDVTCNTHVNSSQRWVTEYYRNALYNSSIQNGRNNPINVQTMCYLVARKPGDKFHTQSFHGRCRVEDNGFTWLGPEKNYVCISKAYRREGPEYVDHTPGNPPGAGACEGCQLARNRTRSMGMSCSSAIGQNIWSLRSTHGIAMAWVTMAIIPLSTLLSRYYKETLMKYRYVNMHVWHGVHTETAFTGFAGLLSGWVAGLTGRLYFGFSTNGVGYLHWAIGYVSILSFLMAFFGSSVRMFKRRWRFLTIFFHFLVGTITRICWTICLFTSIYIPGSPASSSDAHISGFTLEPAVAIIIPWIIVDVAVNVFLMVYLKLNDEKARFSTARTYAIVVPIPLLKPEDEKDFPGAGLKKIVLIVHTAVGILCALLLSIFICLANPYGRNFGHMWYTHKASGKLNMVMNEVFYD